MNKKFFILIATIIALLGFYVLYTLMGVHSVKKTEPVVKETPKPVQDCSVTQGGLLDSINKFRAENGVKPVILTKDVEDLAGKRALEQNGVIDHHAGFKTSLGQDISLRRYILIGEDLQGWRNCVNSEGLISGFKISPDHWKSLMNPRFDTIGVAFYKNVVVVELGDLY